MVTEQTILALFGTIGWPEILIIILAILLLFGGKKLPELARGLGRGMREFKKELHGVKDDIESLPDDSGETADKNADKIADKSTEGEQQEDTASEESQKPRE